MVIAAWLQEQAELRFYGSERHEHDHSNRFLRQVAASCRMSALRTGSCEARWFQTIESDTRQNKLTPNSRDLYGWLILNVISLVGCLIDVWPEKGQEP